ncbi:MAG: substrate import-associated zinc metallohydrolase lipoprotein [Sphingobacterium sp.]
MKKLVYSLLGLSFMIATSSCSKEENLEVDLSTYNYDGFEKLPIDDYIYEQLTKPYNVEVVYRFDRSHTDLEKDISPPRIENVQPAVDMILDGFLSVFNDVAGPTFIKTYTPKQFVLFGSHAYNSNGTVTLGTADGGRRVVLYDINNLKASDGPGIKRRLQTIHHEFTHIVNQIVAIPPSFRVVTTDYVADWVGTDNTEEQALELGFVSRYARSSFGEDFAETVAHLLVGGQTFYDNRIANSSADGAAKLRLKQSIVEDYYLQFLDINFKELQYAMQRLLREQYGDEGQLLISHLKDNYIKSVSVDLDQGSHYSLFGQSDAFQTVWNGVKTELPKVSNNAGRSPIAFNLEFPASDRMQIVGTYVNSSGDEFTARYDLDIVYADDGGLSFQFIDEEIDEGSYNNGRIVVDGWMPLINYFESNTFRADWLSPERVGVGNLSKYGGFFVVGQPENYVYGPVTIK